LSYRRDDTAGHSGRIADRLRAEFGRSSVFIDIDAIEPGFDFVDTIEVALDSAEVVIPVLGHRWLLAIDEHGRRRIDDPNDYVRWEIGRALERGIHVVPVLVDGTSMPGESELPPSLAQLSRLNAVEVRSGASFEDDVSRLIRNALGESGRVHWLFGRWVPSLRSTFKTLLVLQLVSFWILPAQLIWASIDPNMPFSATADWGTFFLAGLASIAVGMASWRLKYSAGVLQGFLWPIVSACVAIVALILLAVIAGDQDRGLDVDSWTFYLPAALAALIVTVRGVKTWRGE